MRLKDNWKNKRKNSFMRNNNNLGLLIIRLSVGFLMLLHGIGKLNGIGGVENMLTNFGLPTFIAYGVYIGEIIAPILIIVGYRTKLASIVLLINCAFAFVFAHLDHVFELNAMGGWAVELLGLYFFGTLALLFTGGGRYAVSHKNKWD